MHDWIAILAFASYGMAMYNLGAYMQKRRTKTQFDEIRKDLDVLWKAEGEREAERQQMHTAANKLISSMERFQHDRT